MSAISDNDDVVECPDCDGTGYAPETRFLSETFYPHQCRDPKTAWRDKLVAADIDALVKEDRLWDFTHTWNREQRRWVRNDPPTIPSPEAVNAWELSGSLGHDAINRAVLVRSRCERLGLPYACPRCNGEGNLATHPLPASPMGDREQ